jgi:hypothetical protein
MNAQEIAAVIERHCNAQQPRVPYAEIMQNPLPRSNKDRLPKLRAAIVRELSSLGLKTTTIAKIFRQTWNTTYSQIINTKKP